MVTGYGETALVRGLTFLAQKQAAIANNLANVDTTSFKRRAAVASSTGERFQSLLDQQLSAIDYVERNDMQRGILRDTGNRLDVAIDGSQWLRVQDQAGRQFYTRNGQLQLGDGGRLETRGGLVVLDTAGLPLLLGSGEETPGEVTFSPNGTIADPTTGKTWGPIAMVELADVDALVPIGQSLYIDTANQTGTQTADGLQQGFLEGSNVDSLQELVSMITVERSFSATQRTLSGLNRMQQNLITNILR
jgi:flagellar basal body rod protein FlgG